MSAHLTLELDLVRKKLLDLWGLSEQSVRKAGISLQNLDEQQAKEVIKLDHQIDLLEVEIEEDCLKILALYQPVAIDLRLVIATLKINNDLERIGDLGVNIAERALYLSQQPPTPVPFDFEHMWQLSLDMVARSLDAFVRLDLNLAKQVCEDDDEVDAINMSMYDKVYEGIRKNPDQMESLIHYLSVSRHLERIADYATNISEDVIYMVEGKIVRHHHEEYLARK
ncbi:MAG: phosphate transport system regulatory protein PhoU [Bdellovibrionales bacterium RBG_16_40_8]|nr:MAG: phosphate transport system regulatory protein PhoU [Bdellovibrionales bacterium RBG_16_40_8]